MREIKFRAWDKRKKYWLSGVNIHVDLYGHVFWNFAGQCKFQEKDQDQHEMILTQFTGLLDKNGREIFEGDVVKYRDLMEMDNTIVESVVEWNQAKCSLQPREIEINHKGGRYWALWDSCIELEIIGNIFENSELLGE